AGGRDDRSFPNPAFKRRLTLLALREALPHEPGKQNSTQVPPGHGVTRLQFANPDVSEPHRVAVELDVEGGLRAMRLIRRRSVVGGLAQKCEVVLNDDAIVQDGDVGRRLELLLFVKARSGKKNVVRLPFPRLATGIDEGWPLLVDRTGLPVEIGL